MCGIPSRIASLRPVVAMELKSPPDATYSVSLPPGKLDFGNTITEDFLKKDFDDVYMKGITMFTDIENSLKEIRPRLEGKSLNFHGSIKEFSDIEEMLKQERSQFEIDIQNAIQNGEQDKAIYKLLGLNRVCLELLIESSVWDHRIQSLLSSDLSVSDNGKMWIWTSFSEIVSEYMKHLQRGNLPKSGSVFETADYKGLILDKNSRIHIPFGSNAYILSDHEDELPSVIASALALLKDNEDLVEDASKERAFHAKTSENSDILPQSFSPTSPHPSSSSDSENSDILPRSFSPTSPHPSGSSDSDVQSSTFNWFKIFDTLDSSGAHHPHISVVCLYDKQFHQLRDQWCTSEVNYIASLSHCKKWGANAGKRKSFFAKSLDDRLTIQEINKSEVDSFKKFAPSYFQYMNECHRSQQETCLAKILGMYQVTIKQRKNGKETKYDLKVTENLSFGRSFDRSYELKGSLHARLNTSGNGSGDVLLDQNFVNDVNNFPLYIRIKTKRKLQRAVWNDTAFLSFVNVMDYSLLVGVDTQRRELVCGIIDYLRQYTWGKQLETWFQSLIIVPKNQLPTAISPQQYKKRFRKFINTHFLSVPDDDDDSSNVRSQGLGEPEDDSTHDTSPEKGKQEDDSSPNKSSEEGRGNGASP